MTAFDKRTCDTIASDIEAALAAVATKHGVIIQRGGGKFNDRTFTLKLLVELQGEAGAEAAKREFARDCDLFGLTPECYGVVFGGQYRLTGIDLRKREYPLIGERISDGKRFKFKETMVPVIKQALAVAD